MNDAAVEPDEMFRVLLSSSTATITGPDTATVTITDTDSRLQQYIMTVASYILSIQQNSNTQS